MEINIAEGNPNSWHSFDATATLGNATTTNITKVNTIQLKIVALCWQDLPEAADGAWAAASTVVLVLPCSSCFQCS